MEHRQDAIRMSSEQKIFKPVAVMHGYDNQVCTQPAGDQVNLTLRITVLKHPIESGYLFRVSRNSL